MATSVPGSVIGAGTAASIGGIGDSLYVLPQVSLISTDSTAVRLFSDNSAQIHGNVHGEINGILMGEEVTGGQVFVGDTGNVSGNLGSAIRGVQAGQGGAGAYSLTNNGDVSNHSEEATVQFIGGSVDIGAGFTGDFDVVNHGVIANTDDGLRGSAVRFENAGALSEIHNSDGALISSVGFGPTIHVTGQVAGKDVQLASMFVLVNAGEIRGTYDAYLSDGPGTDLLTNTGLIKGHVVLGSGQDSFTNSGHVDGTIVMGADNDVFDNHGGLVTGGVQLGGGSDTFDGRGGIVTEYVFGGLGDDTYIIDNSGTNLQENADSGYDTVRSEANFTLGDNFEALVLLGSDDISGTGNNGQNTVTGNAGDNHLFGNGSRDTMDGGAGGDTMDGGRGDDLMNGGAGNDSLFGRAGSDTMTGGEGDDFLFGGFGGDSMDGAEGNDTLKGGLGVDTMTGGSGQDSFVFTKVSDSPNGSIDTITDFVVGEDTLDFTGMITGQMDISILGAYTGTTPCIRTQEIAGNTTIRVDVDGDGSSDMHIDLLGVTGLTESDFLL